MSSRAVSHHRLREVRGVDPPEDREGVLVCTVTAVRRGEEDGRIDECARRLLDVDAPRVVIDRNVGLVVTVVAVEVAERAASLLDDLATERAVVLDTPAERVSISLRYRTNDLNLYGERA